MQKATIEPGILSNHRFLSLSVAERYLFMVMLLTVDGEGRERAHPDTWRHKAGLYCGESALPTDEVQGLVIRLVSAGLVVMYADLKHLFLPGWFEHKKDRKFFGKSELPLPGMGVLQEHPEYLEGLRRLTTKSRMRTSVDPENQREQRRYPELGEPMGCWPGEDGPLNDTQRTVLSEISEMAGRSVEDVCESLGVRAVTQGNYALVRDHLTAMRDRKRNAGREG